MIRSFKIDSFFFFLFLFSVSVLNRLIEGSLEKFLEENKIMVKGTIRSVASYF